MGQDSIMSKRSVSQRSNSRSRAAQLAPLRSAVGWLASTGRLLSGAAIGAAFGGVAGAVIGMENAEVGTKHHDWKVKARDVFPSVIAALSGAAAGAAVGGIAGSLIGMGIPGHQLVYHRSQAAIYSSTRPIWPAVCGPAN